MKNLIAIIALVTALLIVNAAGAQTINNDSTQIEDINLRLDNFSIQHSTGNALVSTGAMVTGIGAAVTASETKKAYKPYAHEPIRIGLPLVFVGGLTSTIGGIINMTAHRKVRSKKYNSRRPNN